MRIILVLLSIITVVSCKKDGKSSQPLDNFKDSLVAKDFRDFKVLDSKYISKDTIWSTLNKDLEDFTSTTYNNLKPLILEQDIPTLQNYIKNGQLTYELLTKFYLYRIRMYNRENPLSLNAVIAINPLVLKEAKQKDKALLNKKRKQPIFGMPILLKDNINTADMPTTAGAVALKNNFTKDAFIVQRLKDQGAIILGKANLSEWAYYFCGNCPSGYSAIGGQTLNPYGRRSIDTGGSSSGSAVAVASNFCVAAVGSETSGSILSPSSQNAIVGLKPTIGLLSRTGIVPISSTLDTPGPMAKNVTDTRILLDAMIGYDSKDFKAIPTTDWDIHFNPIKRTPNLEGMRFGAFKHLLEDTLYVEAISDLKTLGATIIEVEALDTELKNFRRLLNLDMKNDLPDYLSDYGDASLKITSVGAIVAFNHLDSLKRAPYGQARFKGIIADTGDEKALKAIKDTLHIMGKTFFDTHIKSHNLEGILSINNYHAGFAAVAEYPAITVPMGFMASGTPKGLTFIGKPLSEKELLYWAFCYEQLSKKRKAPANYK